MRITGSIILGVVGAILYFAVEFTVVGIDISVIGIILMIAAALWFLVELVQEFSRQSPNTGSGGGGQQQDPDATRRQPPAN